MVVWPTILGISPTVNTHLGTEFPPPAVAVSEIGARLDEMLSVRHGELNRIQQEPDGTFEEVTFGLRPLARTRHRGRLIQRDRPLRFAENPADYEHLL